HQFGGPAGDGPPGDLGVRAVVFYLWRVAGAISGSVVSAWYCAGYSGERDRAPPRPGGRVVHLADPGAAFAFRRRFLSALHPAPLDAIYRASFAGVLRV